MAVVERRNSTIGRHRKAGDKEDVFIFQVNAQSTRCKKDPALEVGANVVLDGLPTLERGPMTVPVQHEECARLLRVLE